MQHADSRPIEVYVRPIGDAARSLGISRAGLYRLIGAKQIRAIKVGHRTMVPESELREFVAERLAAA